MLRCNFIGCWLALSAILVSVRIGSLELVAQEPEAPTIARASTSLPSAWLGDWEGTVTLQKAEGKETKFEMKLHIARTEKPDTYQWTIVYGGEQGKSERPYLLVADESPGQFHIDEQNGIKIPVTLIGNTMSSHFQVGDTILWDTHTLRTDSNPPEIQFELFTANSQSTSISGGKDGISEVESLQVQNRQIAILRAKEKTSTAQPPSEASSSLPAWKKLETVAYRGKQDDIFFVNVEMGWYVNGEGRIYNTRDGGQTWKEQLHKPGTYFRCIAFVDDKHGFAGNIGPGYFPNVTDSTPLYETKDSGETWQAVTTIEGKPVVGLCAMQVLKEEFVNAGVLETRSRIIGVGRVGGPVAMIYSDDLGKTWQQIDISEHAAMAFDVHFFNRNEGFIAAASDADVSVSNGLILSTNDGGKTWKKAWQSERPYELTWKISFPSRHVGYVTIQSYNPDASVQDRFVAKTIDGGKEWKEIPLVSDPKVREFGVAFLDEKTGWVGAVPHGFQTEDGGQTWAKVEMGNAVNKIRILPSSNGHVGYAIGTHVFRIDIPR